MSWHDEMAKLTEDKCRKRGKIRVRASFGSSRTEASAAAIFSSLRVPICLVGTETFCTLHVDSNFSTRRSIFDLLDDHRRPSQSLDRFRFEKFPLEKFSAGFKNISL